MYQKFMIPGKGFNGAGYFQRLRSILLYNPQVVSPEGKLALFVKMENAKLAYMAIK